MKRFVFVFLAGVILHCAVFADIADTISKYTFKSPLIVYDLDYQFFCRLYVSEEQYLFIDNMEDTGGPGLFAYKINKDTLTLIIKHDGYGYSEITHKSYRKIKYFYVELKDVQGEIRCGWREINAISLDGFTITKLYFATDTTVNIMYEPSLNSGIYTALRPGGENIPAIKIIGIGNRREQIHDMYDFWYLIEYENKQLWVFGYYIFFWEGIWLKKGRDK